MQVIMCKLLLEKPGQVEPYRNAPRTETSWIVALMTPAFAPMGPILSHNSAPPFRNASCFVFGVIV